MDEFAFIRDHLAKLAGPGSESLSDDCAWLPTTDGWQVISTDTSVEGVHFPKGMRGASASERAVRVALSDIAAKGAELIGIFVNLTLPKNLDDKWAIALTQGLSDAKNEFGAHLLGGDTTRHNGPLVITVTALGMAKTKILRSGASIGDQIWVSGPVGDAALGLKYMQGDVPLPDPTGADLFLWEEAYLRPVPRFDLKTEIAKLATASVDVSDGLIADAGHIAEASSTRVQLKANEIPLSETSKRWVGNDPKRLIELLTAGDDYQVLICTKPTAAKWLYDSAFTYIGDVREGSGVELIDRVGEIIPVLQSGYTH